MDIDALTLLRTGHSHPLTIMVTFMADQRFR